VNAAAESFGVMRVKFAASALGRSGSSSMPLSEIGRIGRSGSMLLSEIGRGKRNYYASGLLR